MIPAEILDRPPQTEAEALALLQVSVDQLRGVGTCEHELACPCGNQVRLLDAFRCFHCGVFYCKTCALRHFGPAPKRFNLMGPSQNGGI